MEIDLREIRKQFNIKEVESDVNNSLKLDSSDKNEEFLIVNNEDQFQEALNYLTEQNKIMISGDNLYFI